MLACLVMPGVAVIIGKDTHICTKKVWVVNRWFSGIEQTETARLVMVRPLDVYP